MTMGPQKTNFKSMYLIDDHIYDKMYNTSNNNKLNDKDIFAAQMRM